MQEMNILSINLRIATEDWRSIQGVFPIRWTDPVAGVEQKLGHMKGKLPL